jgi:hypothetical protein
MGLHEINRNPTPSELRTFGLMLPVFGALLSGSLWWRSHSWRTVMIVAGVPAAVTLIFFAMPRLRKSIFVGWLYAVFPIGWAISYAVMAVIYFAVMTPIGLAVRWLRGDPLARRFDTAATTYWHRRSATLDRERYLREF